METPDTILAGSTTLVIDYSPAVRLGDPTSHGGVISLGCLTGLIV